MIWDTVLFRQHEGKRCSLLHLTLTESRFWY